MSRFTEQLGQNLDQIADRASPSSTAWSSILTRIDDRADEPDMEVIMLTPDENRRDTGKHPWLMAAAAIAVLALIGGLILAVTRSDDDPVTADQPEQAPTGDPAPSTPLTEADAQSDTPDIALAENVVVAFDRHDTGSIESVSTPGVLHNDESVADRVAWETAVGMSFELIRCTEGGDGDPSVDVTCSVWLRTDVHDAVGVEPILAIFRMEVDDGRIAGIRFSGNWTTDWSNAWVLFDEFVADQSEQDHALLVADDKTIADEIELLEKYVDPFVEAQQQN